MKNLNYLNQKLLIAFSHGQFIQIKLKIKYNNNSHKLKQLNKLLNKKFKKNHLENNIFLKISKIKNSTMKKLKRKCFIQSFQSNCWQIIQGFQQHLKDH